MEVTNKNRVFKSSELHMDWFSSNFERFQLENSAFDVEKWMNTDEVHSMKIDDVLLYHFLLNCEHINIQVKY